MECQKGFEPCLYQVLLHADPVLQDESLREFSVVCFVCCPVWNLAALLEAKNHGGPKLQWPYQDLENLRMCAVQTAVSIRGWSATQLILSLMIIRTPNQTNVYLYGFAWLCLKISWPLTMKD